MTTIAPTPVPVEDSAPTTPPGYWIMASERTGTLVPVSKLALYPCLCSPPCYDRGYRTCPCAGRTTDLDAMPEHCCARNAARASTWHPTPATPPGRQYAAPAQGHDDQAAAPVPRRTYAAPAAARRRRYAAPRSGDLPVYSIPVRILPPGERVTRWPRPGEADCWVCGELIAEHLVSQGIYVHVCC